ncbi:hypothetical protein Esti_005930 [Eimeria stiedai]
MAVHVRLLVDLLFAFALLALSWRSVCASNVDQTQQSASAWEGETHTDPPSPVSLEDALTEEASLTVPDEELALKDAAGAAEGALVKGVVSRRIAGRQHLSSLGKGLLSASAAILLVLLASSRMRVKLQALDPKKAQPTDPGAQPPRSCESVELHGLAAAADRVSELLAGSELREAAGEVSRRAQEVERCYVATQDLAQRKETDQRALAKASARLNDELEMLLDSTNKFLKRALVPMRELKEEASKQAAELQQEAEAPNQLEWAAPHDFALAKKELTGKFAAGAQKSNLIMGDYVTAFEKIAASRPTSLKEAAAAVRRLMSNVSDMKQLSARTFKDCSTVESWKRFCPEASLKSLRVEGMRLRMNLRAILEEVSLKNMTEAAAAEAAKHQETVQKIQHVVNEAPSEEALANASQVVLLNMVEKLRTAHLRAHREAQSVLNDVKEQLEAQGAGRDPPLYKDDPNTLAAFRTIVMMAASLATHHAQTTRDFVNKHGAFIVGKSGEELALAKVAWDHLTGFATETLSAIESTCDKILKSQAESLQVKAAKTLQHARAVAQDFEKTDSMKRATQMALELRSFYDELLQTTRYLPEEDVSPLET